MVKVDNAGAIIMAGNTTATSHTKHVDIKYKGVNEYVEDSTMKTVFAKSAKNDNTILTKTLRKDLYERHSKKIIGEKPE